MNVQFTFFKVDDAENIYKGDIRRNKDITLENESIREVLKEKNFNKFYDLVIERLQNITNGFNELNIENFFYKDVKELEFKKVEDRLRLISQQESKISVYLSSNIIVKGEELNGENLWYEV